MSKSRNDFNRRRDHNYDDGGHKGNVNRKQHQRQHEVDEDEEDLRELLVNIPGGQKILHSK